MKEISMINSLLILLGKTIVKTSQKLNLGNGSTWPGHIALQINKHFIKDLLKANNQRLTTILVVGTNGKTTTSKLIQTILEEAGKKVLLNTSGANLLNGIASILIAHATLRAKLDYDYAVFEVDENALTHVLKEFTPSYMVALNLFRDQLDRYGEVNSIAKKWKTAFEKLDKDTTFILNADDPQIAYLDSSSVIASETKQSQTKEIATSSVSRRTPRNDKLRTLYYGLDDKNLSTKEHQHAVDSTYCPNCDSKLEYKTTYYSHLGDWQCPSCNFKRPTHNQSSATAYPLPGIYNRYNTHAAVLLTKDLGIPVATITQALAHFQPAFGRQEIIEVDGKKVQLFLSKNPTSFNESLKTIVTLGAKNILIVLNDRIPDGRDVSWIWDVDFEILKKIKGSIHVAGDRVYDMAVRMKYADVAQDKLKIHENLEAGIHASFSEIENNQIFYILPTYSAMLETRKIITGKKIL